MHQRINATAHGSRALPLTHCISRKSARPAEPAHALLWTHKAMPTREMTTPAPVPLLTTLPSTYHSPRTVNRNARVLTIGTVRLSSSRGSQSARAQ